MNAVESRHQWGRERRGIVVLPTGSGKTHVALGAIARARVPTLCVVPTRVLLHQWRAILSPHGKGPVGVLGDGQHTIEPVTVATFESAFRMMERIGDRFGLLVIDEAHHFGSGVHDEALEMCAAPARLGLTATPNQNETGSRLAELVGPIVYQLGVSDLAGGFLSSYDIVPVEVELDLDERAAYEASLALFRPLHRAFVAGNPAASWSDFVRRASQTDNGRRALAAWRRSKTILAFPSGKRRALSRLLASGTVADLVTRGRPSRDLDRQPALRPLRERSLGAASWPARPGTVPTWFEHAPPR